MPENFWTLSSEPTHLSSLIGKTCYQIVLHDKKRSAILSTTDEELDQLPGSFFEKIRQFCDKIEKRIDVWLNKKRYNTPSARLGHLDANKLIEYYLQDKINPYQNEGEIVQEFVDKILNPQFEEVTTPMTADSLKKEVKVKASGKINCCNRFYKNING